VLTDEALTDEVLADDVMGGCSGGCSRRVATSAPKTREEEGGEGEAEHHAAVADATADMDVERVGGFFGGPSSRLLPWSGCEQRGGETADCGADEKAEKETDNHGFLLRGAGAVARSIKARAAAAKLSSFAAA
jgi:hypothetical protein